MGILFSILVVVAVIVWWRKRQAAGDGVALSVPAGSDGYRITFRSGRVTRVDGRIPRATLSAFEDIAAHADLDGEVRLVGLAELRFSDDIPPGVRQQLRNAHVTSMHVH